MGIPRLGQGSRETRSLHHVRDLPRGPLPDGHAQKQLPRETSVRHPHQMLEPPQVALLNVEKYWPYSELP